MTVRPWALLAATVLCAVLTAWCLANGTEVRLSTGGLLVDPVPSTRIVARWLLAAAAAGTAALLFGVALVSEVARLAGHRVWRRSRPRS